ncbi:MAG: HAD family hydrolase, partial [Thermoproteota archaeon]
YYILNNKLYSICLLVIMIKGIILDLDGTLLNNNSYYRKFEEIYPGVIRSLLDEDENTINDKINYVHNNSVYGFTKSIREIGINSEFFFMKMRDELPIRTLIRPDPKLNIILKDLTELNYSIVILTNTGKYLVYAILDSLGIDLSIFKSIITSDDTGLKPTSEPYVYALSKLGLSAHESVYVGDRYDIEIKPAIDLGIKTIFITENDKKDADYTIKDIYEIKEILKNIEGQ